MSFQGKSDAPVRYLTTSIPYVNAEPHIGFALELVQADVLARHYRSSGCEVRFQTGTDENSLKNVRAAEALGVPVPQLVAENAAKFLSLKEALRLSFNDFIRTSSHDRHRTGAERLWRACVAAGDVYKRAYRGLYCVGCEAFYKPADLIDGCCPEHGIPPEDIDEENWFFRLSRYEKDLRNAYERRTIEIVPEWRRDEILGWIEQGLEDFSISRSAARARGWGVPVPGDPDQVMYVWFDALGNYLTALDYGAGGDDFSRFWLNPSSREHVIGKGILRFHAIYWPAILLSAALPLPTRILVHGYVTVDGKKIGKSLGNAIDPVPLAQQLGSDALRYYLLRHIRSTGDGDFSSERFAQAYDSELAGQLGNLAHRVLSMIERYCDGVVPEPLADYETGNSISRSARALPDTVSKHLESFRFDKALGAIWRLVAEANKYVSDVQPWSLAKANGDDTAAPSRKKLDRCLYDLAFVLHTVARCLEPLLPEKSRELFRKLGCDDSLQDLLIGNGVVTGIPLFPRHDRADKCIREHPKGYRAG
ncbi:methionine--tRNA ligase [Chelativorans sp. Marseille-P2723]|uniref:methionine--tRNA ligase n=1 Tax=Chelativorans sp. Marseille-P2723 TaxID=2709133 RepID=UPI00156DB884|nr:methionine--tRNA ligase [Chelativorans sp. Marseille-P2723]